MSKTKNNNSLTFLGMASSEVTGSSYLIQWAGKKILVECGMHQTNNLEKDYCTNSRQFNFKPRELDYVFCLHLHADHIGLIPRLVAEGFKGGIIVPKNSIEIAKIMLEDSAHIIAKDCEYLNKCCEKKHKPIYEKEHALQAVNQMFEFEFGKLHQLSDNISFTFYQSQHIISSASVVFTLKDGNKTKKIGYTSDLGNTAFGSSLYCRDFMPIKNCDVLISESTYCSKEKSNSSPKVRAKDLEKIESTIKQFVIGNKKKVLIPCFALHRTQVMLKYIYDIFKDSTEDFDVVIDSPMAVKITELFPSLLTGKEKADFNKMLHWDRLHLLSEYDASKACLEASRPMVILSASGMLSAGRSISHLQSIIEDSESCVLFCGYASPNTLAGQLREGKEKVLKIAGKEFRNKVQLVSLMTMSSHMQHDQLLAYLSTVECNEVYLVHGNSSRYEFAQELEDEYRKNNRTTKVFIGEKDYVLEL